MEDSIAQVSSLDLENNKADKQNSVGEPVYADQTYNSPLKRNRNSPVKEGLLPPIKRQRVNEGYRNSFMIEYDQETLLEYIDAEYPPLLCTACDTESTTLDEAKNHFREMHPSTRKYACLHPHCDMQFASRGALRFHLGRSHLVRQLPKPVLKEKELSPPKTIPSTSSATAVSPNITPPHQAPNSPGRPSNAAASIETPSTPESKSPSPKLPHNTSWRVSSFSKPKSSRAPRGSKKIILSPSSESLLNSVYHPLRCPSCHKTFNRKTNVIKHLTDAHYGEEPYRCVFSHCRHPKRYATREGLVYHILHAHDSVAGSETASKSQPTTTADNRVLSRHDENNTSSRRGRGRKPRA